MGAFGFPALQIKSPTPPAEQMSQVLAVKAAQQNIQAQGLENQARQRELDDQDALTRAMAQWDGKNAYDLPGLVSQVGGSGNAVMKAQNFVAQRQLQASEIAKNDAITNSNNAETQAKLNDQYRGRILNIVGIGDEAQRQAAWDAEVTKEEQAGTIQPGQFSHTYPGDLAALNLANHFALGSQVIKEQQENRKMALDAWKPSGGQLINIITQERIGGLTPMNIDMLNRGLETRWQVLNPGQPLPEQFRLPPNATPQNFEQIDKVLEATERAKGTVAQQQQTNAIRAQTFELARDKADLNAVVGTDPKTGQSVLVPFSQAQQMGMQDAMKADADMVNKALAARHWLTLATKPAPPGAAPQDQSIAQLVDKLDKDGQLGPLASRWNEFMSGKFGAGDPDYAALRAKMGLSTTLLMQAHVGSRGGSALLEHFEDLANAGKMDGPTLKAALGSEVSYVRDKAMDPNQPTYTQGTFKQPSPTSNAGAPPPGATHTVFNRADGKNHWTDANNSKDLGVAP